MKHTTFRKSTLISSVALLLVAIVALSGATFAWFSSSNQAIASGVSVTSVAGGGLQISENGSSWGSSVEYKNGGTTGRTDTLFPASCAFAESLSAPKFFQGMASTTDNYAVNADGFSSATSNPFNAYTLYAKSNEAGTISVTHTPDATKNCGYARIAIVDVTTQGQEKLVYYWRPADDNDYAPVKAAGTTGVLDTAFETRFGSGEGGTNVIVEDNTAAKDIATIASGATAKFAIYVWYEGQDAECTSVMSAQAFMTSFTFNLTPASNG